jgi:hypothetical protein
VFWPNRHYIGNPPASFSEAPFRPSSRWVLRLAWGPHRSRAALSYVITMPGTIFVRWVGQETSYWWSRLLEPGHASHFRHRTIRTSHSKTPVACVPQIIYTDYSKVRSGALGPQIHLRVALVCFLLTVSRKHSSPHGEGDHPGLRMTPLGPTVQYKPSNIPNETYSARIVANCRDMRTLSPPNGPPHTHAVFRQMVRGGRRQRQRQTLLRQQKFHMIVSSNLMPAPRR